MKRSEIKETILKNLRDIHQSKPVNICCALKNVENEKESFSCVRELMFENKVKRINYVIENCNNRYPKYLTLSLYRYNNFQN